MGRGQDLLKRLTEDGDLAGQPLPGQPIVEIAGDRRVLVENHFGVKEYSRERIRIQVKYGYICICGCGLELIRMTKEQLVISGRIDAVTLHRKGGKGDVEIPCRNA